ncbi:hypothetical protein CLOM_g6725 [Closterium sp. NIES-68]|nr:hypothetical protein CLOM_g6725 [Closterium sp. NIES-68]
MSCAANGQPAGNQKDFKVPLFEPLERARLRARCVSGCNAHKARNPGAVLLTPNKRLAHKQNQPRKTGWRTSGGRTSKIGVHSGFFQCAPSAPYALGLE